MLYLGKTGQWQFSAKNLARRKSQRRCGIQSPHTVREKSKLSDFLKRKENGCFLPMPKGRGIRSLVFDDLTGVQYLRTSYGGLCVMVDAEGKPLIWEGAE